MKLNMFKLNLKKKNKNDDAENVDAMDAVVAAEMADSTENIEAVVEETGKKGKKRKVKKSREKKSLRLRQNFSMIAALCGVELMILTVLTMGGASLIQTMQSFQFNEQECQYALVDVVNYLNQTIYWSADTANANTMWKTKIVGANKKFHQFAESSVLKMFPEEFNEKVEDVNSVWTKVVSLVNPFNGQMQALSAVQLTEEEARYIARYGIKAGAAHFEDSEAVISMLDRILIMESNMKDLIRYSNELQDKMTDLNDMLKNLVARWTVIYRLFVIVLGLVFVGLMFISILSGTNKIIAGIKKVRDMSSDLAEKDFTIEIEPAGSTEMQALMGNMNNMVSEINKFFIVVKKTAAKAISSGYSINDSSSSTAAATNEINLNIENITDEFEKINESLGRAVEAVNQINVQVRTLVDDNGKQTAAIDESTNAVTSMAQAIEQIKLSAIERSKAAEEMRNFVADGDSKIAATNRTLAEVMGQLDKIREIVTIINSVSAQTNLLSMNAAIESAHAGEYGKGFAVVAEEIRGLATSTASNAKKITESIKATVASVTEANRTSLLASEAFAKVSSQSSEMIESFAAITTDIETINAQTAQITQKTDVTAETAEKINQYCANLASNQETVASEINSISDLFNKAVEEIREINIGTEEIVKRMDAVGTLSKESYKNMTDLENVLEEFKTSSDDSEELKEEIDNNTIENIISPELQAQLEADFNMSSSSSDSVDFDPDAVEEDESGKGNALPEIDDMFN